jgi:hypothetical protein
MLASSITMPYGRIQPMSEIYNHDPQDLSSFLTSCAASPDVQGREGWRGQHSRPLSLHQRGICWCSMYWRTMEIDAPPQLEEKYDQEYN